MTKSNMNNLEYPEYLDDDEMPEMEKVLLLTRNEALFIDDSLSMLIERDIHDDRLGTVRPLAHTAGIPAPVDLLEKIGKAILFTTDPDHQGDSAEVLLTETDLYMLREITQSYIRIGEEAVGFNLKRKICILLYSTAYERDKVAKRLIAQVDSLPMHEDSNSIGSTAYTETDV